MKQHQNLSCNASLVWWESSAHPHPQPPRPRCPLEGRVTRDDKSSFSSLTFFFCVSFYWPTTSTPVVGEVQQSSQVTGRGPTCPQGVGGGQNLLLLLLGLLIPHVCTALPQKSFLPLVLSPGTNGCEVHGRNCHWC